MSKSLIFIGTIGLLIILCLGFILLLTMLIVLAVRVGKKGNGRNKTLSGSTVYYGPGDAVYVNVPDDEYPQPYYIEDMLDGQHHRATNLYTMEEEIINVNDIAFVIS